MRFPLYSILDRVSGLYTNPVICKTDEDACVVFESVVDDYKINRDDLLMYQIGIWEDETGEIEVTRHRLVNTVSK